MDLSWTDEQQMLAQTLRDVCAKYSTPEIVRALEDDPTGYREEFWKELAGLDLLGLRIPEEFGGMGRTLLDEVVVCEELGRVLAAVPYFTTAAVAAAAIRIGGTTEQKRALLPEIATGAEIISCAWFELDRGTGAEGVQARFENGVLTGTKILVPFAKSATRFLVLARDGEAVDLFLAESGSHLTQEKTMAADAAYEVVFDDVRAERLGQRGSGWGTWQAALDEGLVAFAAYAVGGAARAHEMAVQYAKEREQFGRKIGSFQGLAHPLADTATDIEGARVLVWQAAWSHATGKRDPKPLSAMAKLYACDVFKRTTKVGQQTFGGIGFIRDVDMQLYFRRAKQMELLWLGPRALEERIAAAELDAATPFVGIDSSD
ncbi:MAG: acyl-CoA dehydrogenase family protein [Actinomycetota bacterium]|nr:acyl-CoA/acyl-ACP dehydrogenase [Actinomycetota bacterium]